MASTRCLDAVDAATRSDCRDHVRSRAGLLNDVCNHILEIADLKLACFKGNLAAFVKVRPEARAYFELKSNKLKFHFPKPGPIEGESASELELFMIVATASRGWAVASTPSPRPRESVLRQFRDIPVQA